MTTVMDSPSRRRPLEVPKPEAGLAEWTSKIKALQREVDADEEAEQHKLEEEIRVSRLARSRRSGGAQYAGRLELERSDSPTGAADRPSNRDDALRKLTGDPATFPSNSGPPTHATAPSGRKAEPISLAAFIGGRATGPRLNRPAAQPDAHDPTLFEQRTRADITAPHPLFGSGGVALAGLASKGREVMGPRIEEPHKVAQVVAATPAKNWTRDRTVSTPSPYVSKPADKPQSPPLISHGGQGLQGRVESLYGHANRSTERVTTPSLRSTKSTDKLPQKPVTPSKPDVLRKPLSTIEPPRRLSPQPAPPIATSPTCSRPSSVSPPISTPSLARPVQPQLHPTITGPQIPLSKHPAPAFLKPPQQKDLTPSLSRLQGRGFVQSFVKLSTELEAASAGSTPERAASPKKAAVLDRWNPPQGSPSPSPVSAPPMRKAKTMNTPRTVHSEPSPEPKRPAPPPKAKSHSGSAKPSPKTKSVHGDELPLGSSNTLISYIKPMKTGDNPVTDAPEPQHRSKTPGKQMDDDEICIDEHGMRMRSRSNSSARASPAPTFLPRPMSELASAASGRPLSHPTKDRARVRRKGAGGQTSDAAAEPASPTMSKLHNSEVDPVPLISDTSKPSGPLGQGMSLPVELSSLPGSMHSEEKRPIISQPRGEKIRWLHDSWANQAPIGVKPLHKSPLAPPSPTFVSASTNPKPNKHALPGLTNVIHTVVSPPSPPLTPSLTVRTPDNRPPSSPARHNRIPSTGSRPTVMDVAQAFNSKASPTPPSFPRLPTTPTSPRSPVLLEDRERDARGWDEADNERTITPALMKAERRRSNYEKYASFTLPVLPEEKTPVSSPAGTLKDSALVTSAHSGVRDAGEGVARDEKPEPTRKPDFVRAQVKVNIDVVDEPVPPVNAAVIWGLSPPVYKPDPDLRAVSVEVLGVDGGSTAEITRCVNNVFVFYDTEMLAIVYRAKSRSSGLVATKVWTWRGRKSDAGEREEKKVQELAKRYGTGLIRCEQCGEPQELVHILGGSLVVRQGKRTLWSSENTTMHRVRSWVGLLLVDEVDLTVKNLCSGYSYCISLLDTLWVWYGCGSAPAERDAALRYAQTLIPEKKVVEMEEGQEDEIFWMFLGDEGYASASYWKWRKGEKGVDPRIWVVDCSRSGSEAREQETLPPNNEVGSAVLVLHLAYEIFVLIGPDARGQRRNIKLGMTLAQELSAHTARLKPFRPPVHVLILPSQIPLDLRAAIRGLDDETIHGSEPPDHMNILTLDNAWTQIHQREWDDKNLEDGKMLPLGMAPV